MESLVDVTTTAFEGILGVCVIFAAGYAYNAKQDHETGKVCSPPCSAFAILVGVDVLTLYQTLRGISRKLLLPALVFVTFASSGNLTWKRLPQRECSL